MKAMNFVWTTCLVLLSLTLFCQAAGFTLSRDDDDNDDDTRRTIQQLTEKLHVIQQILRLHQQAALRARQLPGLSRSTSASVASKRGGVGSCIVGCLKRKTLNFLGCKNMCHW
ncbi:uncharacterized protein LOC141914142 [Tubulanus polymorphus]|uniref:uncharacterized protein LOC141914142 n=1 Tax=Tubulanus polymorphus TaxID=672921 RepID=UPI003DA309F9